MPALIPGYEYDIFISYRQNDNRSGWVTEFVKALQEELASTLKEPVSLYFDANPHDGLLETHQVNKSLEGKLKCLIFIPIVSQTYCDPKSFAWEHEFCAFNRISKEDLLGRDIRLANGNVASRILPIRIHDLDAADKALLETELKGVLRAVDFIYKESGVNRPLKADDNEKNLNGTRYRNQVNKVANAIKELVVGLQQTSTPAPTDHGKPEVVSVPYSTRNKITLVAALISLLGILSFTYYYFGGYGEKLSKGFDRSIAVLPFENMNNDPEQDYFSNGITEDILNHLTKISDLKVKSRTSTLQYKGTQKSIPEIGQELSVGNVVEGSVRRVGNQVRIVVQLIDAKTDVHLWSETYDRELKDVLSLQSQIAIEIARALEARLTAAEKENIQKEVAQDVTAYDYFLKARELYNNETGRIQDIDNAILLVNQALKADPGYSKAYGLKGNLWYARGYFGASQKTWYDSAMYFSSKAIALDPSLPDGYLVQADVYRYLGNFKEAQKNIEKAYTIAPNDPEVMRAYGYYLLRQRKEQGADLVLKSIESSFSVKDPEYYTSLYDAYAYTDDVERQEALVRKSVSLDPGSIVPHISLAWVYQVRGQNEKGIAELKEADKISPDHQFISDQLAWAYFRINDLESAAKYWAKYPVIEGRFEDSTQTIPFRARLGMVYAKQGKKKEADALFEEDLKIRADLLSGKRSMGAWGNRGSIYYDMALDNAYFGKDSEAVQYLDSAFEYQFYYNEGYDKDPIFSKLAGRSDFKKLMVKVNGFVQFRRSAFSNAINRMEASNELKQSRK